MRIKIIQIGKNKNKNLEEIFQEYVKRLKPYISLENINLNELNPTNTYPIKKCIEEEGEHILSSISNNEIVIALDERGKEFNSRDFSKLMKGYFDYGEEIVFVIGGPYGLSEKVKKRATHLLSLSKMTFTHEMVRIFLIEQIYRGVLILKGKEYHND